MLDDCRWGQRVFQKYEVGHLLFVSYHLHGIIPYRIVEIIPEEKRPFDKSYPMQYYRMYKTKPVVGKTYGFTMSEDEIDRHKPCTEEEAQDYIEEYYKNIVLDLLKGRQVFFGWI